MAQSKYFHYIHPYMRRGYGGYGGGGAGTSPEQIGTSVGNLISSIGEAIQRSRQNAIANRIMNTQGGIFNAPRAGLVTTPSGQGIIGPTGQTFTPAAGLQTTGTAPVTGGLLEYQSRIADAQNQQKLAAEAFKQRQAQTKADLLAQAGGGGGAGGGRNPWLKLGGGGGDANAAVKYVQQGGKAGGKPGKYVPGSSDPQDPSSDDLTKIQADVNQQYPGAYARLMNGLSQAKTTAQYQADLAKDPKATPPPMVIDPTTGDVTLNYGKAGVQKIPGADAKQFLTRINATRVTHGQEPVLTSSYATQNPQSGEPAGNAANPYTPQTPLEQRALPYDSYYVDPRDGKTYQNTRPTTKAGTPPPATTTTTAAPPPATEPDTGEGTTGEGDTGEGTTGEGDTGEETSSAAPTTNPTPLVMGGATSDQVAQSLMGGAQTGEEDARRAQVADALTGGNQTDQLAQALEDQRRSNLFIT